MTAQLTSTGFLYGQNSGFIEELYGRYLSNPASVDPSWAEFFNALGDDIRTLEQDQRGPSWRPDHGLALLEEEGLLGTDGSAMRSAERARSGGHPDVRGAVLDTIRAAMLIRAYRIRGHLKANLDPLGIEKVRDVPLELEPTTYGFGPGDLDRPIFIDNMLGLESATMREILEILQRTYCGTIGIEFMHIADPVQKQWIQERIEGRDKEVQFTPEGKRAILNKLSEAEGFERFLQLKYTGTKRFGLEGGEALIPAMEAVVKTGGQLGLRELVLGMPHRGRLNMLATFMRKPFRAIFSEFQGNSANPEDVQGSGDVKYHLGTSSDREFDGNNVHLSLSANPSHLEAVNPVVLGKARAKQAQLHDAERDMVLPVLMHGDAAFAGQGVVAECFALSELRGYRVGGCLHFIVNNQIGFTTSPRYARSSPYPSDVAKVVQAPIFHVNGDDPEAVVYATKIATEFRQRFKKDVVVDMFCYRRHGHNEADEPAFTQPLMYRRIAQHPTTRQIYAQRLIAEQVVTEGEAEAMLSDFHGLLEQEFEAASGYKPNKADWLEGRWSGMEQASGEERRGETSAEIDILREIGRKLVQVPEGFTLHRTLKRIFETKRKAIEAGEGIDWATAEALAFGTLCLEGFPVRLSGQDSGRGTFSQRHAVLHDQNSEDRYVPLDNLRQGQAHFEVHDSLLSEFAVLGFEYGYTQAEPRALVLWEAQFGDFANGAQVIIDQFIASAEIKWQRMSGLVLLLPHGYEGNGPEHSSARLERYLQLSAEDNWQVVNCTTPSNYFHVLRRQMHRKFRKPLVIMTPKSLLRHRLATSTLAQMGPGTTFHRILYDDDHEGLDPKKVDRVVLCSGKVYFDLLEQRRERGLKNVYLMRLEQLYPFPHRTLATELAPFKRAKKVVWCQEEPKNMGAWYFLDARLEAVLADTDMKVSRAVYAGRREAASTATGLLKRHQAEQAALVAEALEG